MGDMSESDISELSEALASSGEHDDSESEYGNSRSIGAGLMSLDDEDLQEEPAGDENAMGKTSGDPYTAADNRVMAKYIATFDDWHYLYSKDRWTEFTKRVTFSCLVFGCAVFLIVRIFVVSTA